jgi:hypothetical protein
MAAGVIALFVPGPNKTRGTELPTFGGLAGGDSSEAERNLIFWRWAYKWLFGGYRREAFSCYRERRSCAGCDFVGLRRWRGQVRLAELHRRMESCDDRDVSD